MNITRMGFIAAWSAMVAMEMVGASGVGSDMQTAVQAGGLGLAGYCCYRLFNELAAVRKAHIESQRDMTTAVTELRAHCAKSIGFVANTERKNDA